MSITIPFDDRVISLTAIADQTVFDTDFPILDAADLAVYRVRAGVQTLLSQSADYVVSQVGEQTGARVTLVVGALDADKYVLRGARQGGRTTGFTTPGGLDPQDINDELNAQEIELLERQRDAKQALSPKPSASASDPFDGRGLRASNFADAVDDQDLVTKSQMDASTVDVVADAQAAQLAAEAAQTAAEDAEATALAAEGSASSAAVAAAASAAGVNLPAIVGGDAGKTLQVNVAENGYEHVAAGAGAGDVTAASAFGVDNRLIRSDGTGKGVQSSGIATDDSNNVSGINNLTVGGYADYPEIVTPANPTANTARIYAKDDGGITRLAMRDSAGVETVLGADATAVHDNVSGEIAAVVEKVTPVSADLLLIEDSAAGNAKKRVQIGNLPSSGGGGGVETLIVVDEKANGTNGGGFTAGAWRTRDLNTVKRNNITGSSLSANQITLPAGDYEVWAYAPAYSVNEHKLRLRDVTNSVTLAVSSSAYAIAGTSDFTTPAILVGAFTLAGTATLELQHSCSVTVATHGFGYKTSLAQTDEPEVYAQMKIQKV